MKANSRRRIISSNGRSSQRPRNASSVTIAGSYSTGFHACISTLMFSDDTGLLASAIFRINVAWRAT